VPRQKTIERMRQVTDLIATGLTVKEATAKLGWNVKGYYNARAHTRAGRLATPSQVITYDTKEPLRDVVPYDTPIHILVKIKPSQLSRIIEFMA
jgi:hypothetical protein